MDQPVGTHVSNTAFIALLSRYCRLTAAYRREAGTFVARGSLINVSSSGVQIAAEEPPGPAVALELVFSVEGQAYRHPAHAVRSEPYHGGYLLTARFEPGPFERITEVQSLGPGIQSQA